MTHLHQSATPQEAWDAICAGRTVRIVVGSDPEDPICLHYLDRCYEDFHEPMIYTESIGGWSEGIKEAVCKPHDEFYVKWIADPPPLSIAITDETPIGRESREPVALRGKAGE